ncbi:MAG TPA: imelysin family protein, partial [Polyangiaceae bacterium]|nr:imelysin family protein [Polyangiaceae bacterium]
MLALGGFAAGCGDDDDDQPNNPAGSAGSAGKAGGAGSGGSAGGGSGSAGSAGGGGGGLTADEQKALTAGMHTQIAAQTTLLKTASVALCAAAPTTAAGWNEATAVAAMKAAWIETRAPYERIEGVIAPLFPDTDAAIDERYDGFMEELGAAGDQNLFDDQGVTGMHAIERILYKDVAGTVLADEAETV